MTPAIVYKKEEVEMEAEELLKKRFRELAQKCYQNNQYTFTGFLSLADMTCFYEIERELSYVPYKVWGGSELCERVMLRFGSKEEFGYEEEFPITCIQVKPLMAKFADELGHRDFLGALMNLGIERSTLGDIFIEDNTAYIFCVVNMAEFMIENLGKVKHTSVLCKETEQIPSFGDKEKQEIRIQISSERIDAVISKVYRLSRSEAIEFFRQKKVFVNGRQCENNSQSLKSGDIVSVRGCGRYEYSGVEKVSKKGKLNVVVSCFGKR